MIVKVLTKIVIVVRVCVQSVSCVKYWGSYKDPLLYCEMIMRRDVVL